MIKLTENADYNAVHVLLINLGKYSLIVITFRICAVFANKVFVYGSLNVLVLIFKDFNVLFCNNVFFEFLRINK